MRTFEIKDGIGKPTTLKVRGSGGEFLPSLKLHNGDMNIWTVFIFKNRRQLKATINALQRALDEWN